jgi:hypothetical protein
MGFVPKMKYVDHNVREVAKFLELAQDVYMENKGKVPLGDLIFYPKQWIAWLYNSSIMIFFRNTSLQEGGRCQCICEETTGESSWRIFVDGKTCPD